MRRFLFKFWIVKFVG
ncbi:hypothetical protein MTR67_012396 [Solanum verrucosum]|uniref:Uncharacterized protein n=1 Tax=Solanum verrucosum TaxID=315347 RepID=A0AAF0TGZ0_SOLVR|nr:hypothetical protein MTR67_001223 [Solanum verrucosum]WMV19007.1 hypothetical protein MTR67_012392 [Solanum verrucosum]WMV19008.1 hypothetical protein MTR67_012393 [Solanum verrucosum]WMV19009.1 hypothetical protein MTR67_012394 [Solanum verrucosum]WMV19010.1 hypothetical protein MTR67_012395 [Solanum verrucosum]